jgi:hypothetical protein
LTLKKEQIWQALTVHTKKLYIPSRIFKTQELIQTFEPSGFMLMSFAAFEASYLHSSRVFRHGMLFVQSESEKPSSPMRERQTAF